MSCICLCLKFTDFVCRKHSINITYHQQQHHIMSHSFFANLINFPLVELKYWSFTKYFLYINRTHSRLLFDCSSHLHYTLCLAWKRERMTNILVEMVHNCGFEHANASFMSMPFIMRAQQGWRVWVLTAAAFD